jgi:predicted Zn-dependent peptidase
MLHRGTPRYPSAHALALAFEELGSDLEAVIYVDHAVLSSEAPPENLEAVIDLLGEVVRAPIFSEIEIERGIVREEILDSLNDRGESVSADELVVALAFPEHPLGRPITGTLASVERFDLALLQRFHREHYVTENMVVSVCGPIDSARVTAAVERAFAGIPRTGVATAAPPEAFSGPRFGYVADPGSKTAVRIGLRAPGEADPLERATELLVRVLHDGMSTRLYHAICDERGLSYDASASYEAFSDSGLLVLSSDSAPERIEALLEAMFAVTHELSDSGPTDTEVEKAKRRFAWQSEAMFDDPLDLAEYLGLGALTGVCTTPWERSAELARVRTSEVHAAARALFVPERLALAIVGQLNARQRRAVERLTTSFWRAR